MSLVFVVQYCWSNLPDYFTANCKVTHIGSFLTLVIMKFMLPFLLHFQSFLFSATLKCHFHIVVYYGSDYHTIIEKYLNFKVLKDGEPWCETK